MPRTLMLFLPLLGFVKIYPNMHKMSYFKYLRGEYAIIHKKFERRFQHFSRFLKIPETQNTRSTNTKRYERLSPRKEKCKKRMWSMRQIFNPFNIFPALNNFQNKLNSLLCNYIQQWWISVSETSAKFLI